MQLHYRQLAYIMYQYTHIHAIKARWATVRLMTFVGGLVSGGLLSGGLVSGGLLSGGLLSAHRFHMLMRSAKKFQ